MASAGAQAIANNASTAFHNPAGMTRLDDHAALMSAGFLVGDIKFDASASTPFPSNDGGQQGGPAPVLGAHYVHRLYDRPGSEWLDRVRAGIALISISGAVLDPNNDWSGRFEVQELSLLTLSALPSLAVRLHETFSVGAGANLMYGQMDYKLAVPLPPFPPLGAEGRVKFDELDDFEAGATVSALWEPTKRTRLGVLWQQELNLDLSGDIKLSGVGASANIKTKIPFAEAVRVSLVHELTPDLWLAANFRWEDWSSFSKQFVNVDGFKTQIDRGWDDTFGGSVGLRYQLAERWAVLGGFGYDSSPVNTRHRTADMPVDEQIRVTAGVQYGWGETRTLGANFSYANLGDAKIRSETLAGSYDSNNLFSFSLYFSFDRLPWSSAN
jgi:long-chain fatty acid transport protein